MNLFRSLTVWYVALIPVVAGMSTLEFQIGGFNYTGYMWLVLLPVGVFLLATNRLTGTDPGGIIPCWPWLVWCGFVCLSVLWSYEIGRRNVQEALQFSMPVIVAFVAASAVRTPEDLRKVFAAFGVSLCLLLAFTLAYVTERFDREWMDTHVRAAALAATLVGCVFLAWFPRYKLLPLTGWASCLLITALTSSRIATAALLLAPLIHPLFRRPAWKVAVAGAVMIVGLLLFQTETFQEHFFETGQGTLQEAASGNIKDFGRADAWYAIWNEALERPLIGSGVGSAFDFVPTVWNDMNHVHNDYLRVFYELGFLGLTLFLFVCVWQLVSLRRQIRVTEDGPVRIAFVAVWLGFCALLLTCSTDNTIIYHMFYMNPLFALLGAAYGVAWAEQHPEQHDEIVMGTTVLLPPALPRLKEIDRGSLSAMHSLPGE